MIIRVQVKNWDKYNPRSDVKSSVWYRQQNDFFNDPNFYKATPETRLVFIYILCQASKKMAAGEAKINLEMVADQTLIVLEKVQESIKIIEKMGLISLDDDNVISARSDTIVKSKLMCSTNERTDGRTDEHDLHSSASKIKLLELDLMINSWNEASKKSHLKPCPLVPTQKILGLAEKIKPFLDGSGYTWQDYFKKIIESEFLKTKKGAPITILWALDEENFNKIIFGNFDDRVDPLKKFFEDNGIKGF